VVLMAQPTPAQYREALAAGVTALPAGSADEDVVLAVGAAVRAFTYLPADAARVLAGNDGDRPVITEQEACWLRALVDGSTVASLARTVGYSEREMYRVLGNLYGRLGAANRTEALLRADRWGLLTSVPEEGTTRRSRVPGQRRPARC
jgi:DNA-binding NarL/FixJ family response regulator